MDDAQQAVEPPVQPDPLAPVVEPPVQPDLSSIDWLYFYSSRKYCQSIGHPEKVYEHCDQMRAAVTQACANEPLDVDAVKLIIMSMCGDIDLRTKRNVDPLLYFDSYEPVDEEAEPVQAPS